MKKSAAAYRWYNMNRKPLKFDVLCGNKVVIPAGTTYVKIAFGQSHLTYKDPETGAVKHMNVYLHKGKCYHA